MKPMPRSAMQVSPQRAAIRAEQGSQGLKKFDQANYQNRQATMQQAQQGMGQPFRDPNQLTRQGIRRFEGNAALKQYDQEMYKEKQNPNYVDFGMQPRMPTNVVGGLGGQNRSYGGVAGGIFNTADQIDDRKNFISGAGAGLGEQAYAGGDPYRQATMQQGLQAQQAAMNQAAQQAAQRMSEFGRGMPANVVGGLGSGIAAGLGGQAYAGGNPNFDERSGQFNNLIRYNDPRSAQGPDRMGMPQAYPDRIADPMRPQGDRGPLTRVSPGVYRNTQGQLTGPGGRVMPNQPNRNPAQGNATDMWNNMQPQNPQGNISDMFNNMVQQPGYPNGKGPARDVYSPMGAGRYDINQAQNPIYRTPGYSYNLPQNTNVMPGWAGPRPSFSPGQYLNRGR